MPPNPAPASLTTPASPSDEALMQAYAAGDGEAFNQLYARHQAPLYRYVLRTVQAPQVAADVFQDAWMKLVQAAPDWVGASLEKKVAPWLYTVARNRALDHVRAFKNQVYADPETPLADDDTALHSTHEETTLDYDLATILHNQRLGAALIEAIEALPFAQREAFVLQADAGMDLARIAALTEVGIETVKSRLRYARGALKTALQAGNWHD